MPIKRIQLRGISRRPSDRMNADGGCAESLNVHLEEGELAPTLAPQVMTGLCDLGDEPDKYIFIHKWGSYAHTIGIDGQVVRWYKGGAPPAILTLGTGETLSDIKSVGNTLIVASSAKMYYALCTGTTYKYLGNQIPIPHVSFRIGNMTKMRANANVVWEADNPSSTPPYDDYGGAYYDTNWELTPPSIPHSSTGETHDYGSSATRYVFQTSEDNGFWNILLNKIWEYVDEQVYEKMQSGKAVFPMFVRYAVRLYDGTVYAQSIPVLLGGDISKFIDIKSVFTEWYSNNSADTPKLLKAWNLVDIAEAYSVCLKRESASTMYDDWKDLVSGVDIFVSPQMFPVLRNAAKFRTRFNSEYVDPDSADAQGNHMMNRYFSVYNFSLDPYHTEDHQEELVTKYQTTFLAKSYTVDEFKALSGDVTLSDLNLSSDWLMTQESLKETPGSMHLTKAKDLYTYNKRLMLGRASQELSHGYAFLPSSKWGSGTGGNYRFVYHIRGSNGECIVRSRDVSGNETIGARTNANLVVGSSTNRVESLCAWISYPDSRCYLVDIFKTVSGTTTKVSLAMKPSAELDIAYAFIGFGTAPSFASTSDTPATEKATYNYENSLLISKFENPFVFDTTDIVSFDGKVINIAAITHPLSQGQVGQFALYVFTDEGIVSPAIKDDGGFGAISVVSRDVLLSKTALVAIEQGIFFVTKKGVMLLQGMTITDISKNMIGRQYVLDTALNDKIPSACSGFVADSTPFMSFMASCHIAFDYTGKRLIFFNSTKAYQYVYMFETETWHKMVTASGAIVVLNSYPQCEVSIGDALYKFDTVIDDAAYISDTDNTKIRSCVIITRSFDLEEPDVRKTIKSIRIRGRYNRNDVQYLLLGSFDGMHWKLLPSLRGGSYKMFRLFIRASLAPTERISWVDVDYESRYATKLR